MLLHLRLVPAAFHPLTEGEKSPFHPCLLVSGDRVGTHLGPGADVRMERGAEPREPGTTNFSGPVGKDTAELREKCSL